ncbi:RDD family protein [Gottfriedia acidiceleris]|uniref:RDD family protein n=1 Tax=Gottfriedia acidiceleris TaxID=371036 RepID=A0ABY4JP70_9BACI|nr:RDD family protein [Gottfriedia acidiceleris]UPM55619.1 RDD family protein [Gottfriedia acidiceleris]
MESYSKLASRSSRLLAILVDGFISFLFIFAISIITGMTKFSTFFNPTRVEKIDIGTSLLSIICVIIFYILIPTFVWKGQTVGKRWLNIAIVKNDDQEVNLKTMIIREIFFLLGYIKIPYFSLVVGLVAFIDPFFIFSSERRTLHDLIAKTKVIDV